MPKLTNVVIISAIFKGNGEFTDLESERGIFIVTIIRTILMKMIYADKYRVIDTSMSDSCYRVPKCRGHGGQRPRKYYHDLRTILSKLCKK